MIGGNLGKYKFKFDPLNKYSSMSIEHVFNTVGVLSGFILQDYLEPTTAQESFNANFKYPINWRNVASDNELIVTDEGVFKYVGDPDLFPIVSFINSVETIWIYPSGWVVIVDPYGAIRARID